ncbi:hypothetical protein BMS3Bbin11_00149 [bacterium BMS3Bbin11]|nr:hypothetical protein BMS3Abin11_00511 [bacterium BMS3Abin11]GBE45070.1 hypothetical protein BMS3Bbin11_00149 [bacterium BMS3Bbin11]GMT41092.1 MAG: hypothetical protein IEMM0001_1827 [bacterium]
MHIIIIAWLYVMMMVSISYWPDHFGIIWRFVLFGLLPAFLWFKMVMFVRRRPDDQARSASPSDHSLPVDDAKKNAAGQ